MNGRNTGEAWGEDSGQMELSEKQIRGYTKRLLVARMHILSTQGFYGLLLMHMKFSLDEQTGTAATDGVRIYFAPSFLDELSDQELEFVMLHEILHAALQHCSRTGGRDPELFNIACDIVVNSNILRSRDMDADAITLDKYGESMHIAPDGREGYVYTAEQVYEMLCFRTGMSGKPGKSGRSSEVPGKVSKKDDLSSGKTKPSSKKHGRSGRGSGQGRWDDHSRWTEGDSDRTTQDRWNKRILDAAEAVRIQDPSNSRGLVPAFAERLIQQLRNPRTDWRSILSDFVQEEITDYSFTPPDRRFADSGFFLPDYNEKEEYASDVLFMIDTSGSMSDAMITDAYSEVRGAIDQYDGKLSGWLGFFDAAVTELVPFASAEEMLRIRPVGGGGTDFRVVFDCVRTHYPRIAPCCIIILTDGHAPFPQEKEAMGIPVLWLLNDQTVVPPWGRVARINREPETIPAQY